MSVVVYTDGSVDVMQKIGGWGFIAEDSMGLRRTGSGFIFQATNQRAELMAGIQALEYFHQIWKATPLILYSDSMYMINGITDYIYKWKMNGWRGTDGKLIKNIDLWKRLYIANSRVLPDWRHVKGHTVEGNVIADSLAAMAVERGRKWLKEYPQLPIGPIEYTLEVDALDNPP